MSILKYWFPVLGYSGIIFFLSSLEGSSLHTPVIIWDKLEHGIEYSILGFLTARAFVGTWYRMNMMLWLAVIVCCVSYGFLDEFHQSFVPGRDSSLWDVLADGIGGIFGIIVYIIFNRKKACTDGSHKTFSRNSL